MEKRKVDAAIHCLRNELTPRNCDTQELHLLARSVLKVSNYPHNTLILFSFSLLFLHVQYFSYFSAVMCRKQKEIHNLFNWDGGSGSSRQNLLDELQKYISSELMLQPHRLEFLLHQSLLYQTSQCKFHNSHLQNYSYLVVNFLYMQFYHRITNAQKMKFL